MSTKGIKIEKGDQVNPTAFPKFNKVILLDDSDVAFFSCETLLKEVHISREIKREISASSVINKLKSSERLSDIPELIFMDINTKKTDGFKFLDEFNNLSDFVKSKCKIVVLSNNHDLDDKKRILLHPSVIMLLHKPIDAFHLKELL